MSESLGSKELWAIAEEVAELGPCDHGENRNRWGSITARVKAARVDAGLPSRGTGDEVQTVWSLIKNLIKSQEAA